MAERLKSDIIVRRLTANARYYSDRELVAQYGISLLTVRQAVSELVKEGLLQRRHGSGTFISEHAAAVGEKARRRDRDAILFTGWSLATLTGWDAMYFRDIFEGIQEEATARGLRLISDDTRPPNAHPQGESEDYAGVVALVGRGVRERVARLAEGGARVVTVNFRVAGLPSVRPDDYAGARLAVTHLLELGHRRVVHLNSGETELHWTEVKRGYADAIAEAGLEVAENRILESSLRRGSLEAGYELASQFCALPKRPTAVVAGNDMMAIGALQYLNEHRIAVPGRISVVGFDNIEAAQICSPALTTVAVDRVELGRMAVRRVLDDAGQTGELAVGQTFLSATGKADRQECLSHQQAGMPVPPETLSPVRLQIRGSTGPAAKGDE